MVRCKGLYEEEVKKFANSLHQELISWDSCVHY